MNAAYSKKERKAEKRQNAKIAKAVKRLAAIQKAAKALAATVTTQGAGLDGVKTFADQIDARLKLIEGAAPQIIDGLAALKAGLETAGAGLTKIQTFLGSTEYGIGQLIVLTPAPDPQEGSFIVTPDIPDTVQQAQATQQFVAQQSGNLAVAYGVRSGESDGTGADKPAAFCKVTVTNAAGATETTAANPNLGGLPFQPVNTKSALTSTDPLNAGFPFGLKTNGADADSTTTFVSTVAVTATQTYTVGLSCVDTSPDAADPSA